MGGKPHCVRRHRDEYAVGILGAGWNVVTSSNKSEAYNFGRAEHYEHGERYQRAIEFTDVVRGLWDSWDDDAFVRDRAAVRYFIPEKLHVLNHRGEHFYVRGPLNVARPPQGHPVLFQAGSSEPGKELAARIAEGVFTPLHSLPMAQTFYKDLKARTPQYGRLPEHIKIMPGLNPIVGRTAAEATEKHAYLETLIHPEVGIELLSNAVDGFDLRPFALDRPLPEAVDATLNKGSSTAFRNVLRWAREEKLTIRQLYQRFAGARGQRTLVGSPAQIVDDMESWFLNHGCDGFLVQPSTLPGGLDDFVALVIPELQERGLFRTEYEGPTLRDQLGLPRPKSRYAHEPSGVDHPASCHSLNLAVVLARLAAHQVSSLMNTLSLSFGLVGSTSTMLGETSFSASYWAPRSW